MSKELSSDLRGRQRRTLLGGALAFGVLCVLCTWVHGPELMNLGNPLERSSLPGLSPGSLSVPKSAIQSRLDQALSGQSIGFESGSERLTAQGRSVLDGLVPSVNAATGKTVEIRGHTDTSGPDAANWDLSLRRAESVRAYLNAHGAKQAKFQVKGFGPSQPIADNATAEGRAKNRRIEFHVKED
jgi:outer membrane protein OmpA-like peptidoglycan-associated protein